MMSIYVLDAILQSTEMKIRMGKLYIPKKIKVGFQNRKDTFTGKLAYVIYFDDKGILRKESSWESWRDSKIEPIEFDNTPRNGYLFNTGIRRDGYYWGGMSVNILNIQIKHIY